MSARAPRTLKSARSKPASGSRDGLEPLALPQAARRGSALQATLPHAMTHGRTNVDPFGR
jgi:hypothetical protein